MVTRGPEYRPLTIGMQAFFGQDPRLWGDLMAFSAMITLPVLAIFLLLQKWFVQSVALVCPIQMARVPHFLSLLPAQSRHQIN